MNENDLILTFCEVYTAGVIDIEKSMDDLLRVVALNTSRKNHSR